MESTFFFSLTLFLSYSKFGFWSKQNKKNGFFWATFKTRSGVICNKENDSKILSFFLANVNISIHGSIKPIFKCIDPSSYLIMNEDLVLNMIIIIKFKLDDDNDDGKKNFPKKTLLYSFKETFHETKS